MSKEAIMLCASLDCITLIPLFALGVWLMLKEDETSKNQGCVCMVGAIVSAAIQFVLMY